VAEVMKCDGPLYERLWQPVLNAALNTDPKEASARLAATIIWETLAAGGRASRPLIAAQGLSNVFVDPAIECLQSSGTSIRFGHRLRAIGLESGRAVTLNFGDESASLPADSAVVIAVPPWVAASLVPGLTTPSEFRAIVNAHFRVKAPADFPAMIGVVNGTVEWIFAFPDRLSVTISAGDRLLDAPREALARDLWREVAAVANIADDLPPWQIIKERRATFAALPSQEVRRPDAKTAWDNLVLAGDWTATGLPGTIEGAIRSGNRAADLILQA
jgi:squalene-associated FAD-dependent desaturase